MIQVKIEKSRKFNEKKIFEKKKLKKFLLKDTRSGENKNFLFRLNVPICIRKRFLKKKNDKYFSESSASVSVFLAIMKFEPCNSQPTKICIVI